MHYLQTYLDQFIENLGVANEQQGKRFHKGIKEMERQYQGSRNTAMLIDYAWMLKNRAIHVLFWCLPL